MPEAGESVNDRFLQFFVAGGEAFLQGFLEKSWCGTWCFCGEVVVGCVVNVVT
jgi:hypothetical protein